MDLQRGLLTKLVDEDGLNKVKRSGIDISFLDDSDCKQVFSYVERHYSEYKKVPSRAAVKQSFPNFSFVDYPEPLDFFIDQVKEGYRRSILEQTLLNVNRTYTESTVEAEAQLRNLLKSLSVTQRSFKDLSLTDSVEDRIERYERSKLGENRGILTSWSKIDYQTMGFRPEEFVVLVGEKYIGKALAVDTPIPTPTGWIKIGDIEVGNFVFDEQGRATSVVAVTEVLNNEECYELTFSNGEVIKADANHKWLVNHNGLQINYVRDNKLVLTTKEIADSFRPQRYSVDLPKPLKLPEANLVIQPYTFGAWLGDGTSRYGEITNEDMEVWEAIKAEGYSVSDNEKDGITHTVFGIQPILRELGVLNNKHIPIRYLRSSFEQRLALLQGILDTDGSCDENGACEITQKRHVLINQIRELLTSLGIQSYQSSVKGYFRLTFNPGNDFPVFRLERKQCRLRYLRSKRCSRIRIKSIQPIKSTPVRCIQVENKSSLFLVGYSMLPTHNSWLMLWMAYQAMQQGERVLFATKEMSAEDLADRFDSILAGVSYDALRRGELSNVEERRYRDTLKELMAEGSSGSITMARHSIRTVEDIRTKSVEVDATIAFIDSVYLFDPHNDSGPGRNGNETSRRMAISQSCKCIAQELGIPIVASTQAGRSKSQKSGPDIDAIEWSNAFSQDADVVIQVTRDDIDKELHQGWLHALKVRKGQPTEVCVRMDFNYMKFDEINVSKEPSYEPLVQEETVMWTQ